MKERRQAGRARDKIGKGFKDERKEAGRKGKR